MIVIRSRRLLLVAQLLPSVVAVPLGLLLCITSLRKPGFDPASLLMIPFLLFFGWSGGITLRRLFSHRVALILDRRGVLDNSTMYPAGFIAWAEIARTGIVRVNRSTFLGMDVDDRDALYGRSKHSRHLWENAHLHNYPVLIPAYLLDRKTEDLVQLIERYRSDKIAREQLDEFGGGKVPA